MKKMFFIATTPFFFDFFKGQLKLLGKHFDVTIISKNTNNKLEEIASREASFYKEIIIERPITPLADIKALFQLYKLFRKEKPYIVHGNTPKGALLSMIAAKLAGVKHRIYMCHGLRFQGASGLFGKLLFYMEKITCVSATEVICVSQGIRDLLTSNNLCSESKAVLLGHGSSNGLNTEYFNVDQIPKKTIENKAEYYNIDIKNDFIFLFVGRFVKDKGVYELIKAFNKINKNIKNTKLLIVGPIDSYDSYYDKIECLVKQNDDIIFTGRQQDIRPFLCLASILVLPSYREGFGMVLAEAAAMNVPIIASNIEGCNNVVLEYINGIFCEPKNIESLEKAMLTMLQNPKLYFNIKKKTRNSIIDRYEQKKIWKMCEEYYLSLV